MEAVALGSSPTFSDMLCRIRTPGSITCNEEIDDLCNDLFGDIDIPGEQHQVVDPVVEQPEQLDFELPVVSFYEADFLGTPEEGNEHIMQIIGVENFRVRQGPCYSISLYGCYSISLYGCYSILMLTVLLLQGDLTNDQIRTVVTFISNNYLSNPRMCNSICLAASNVAAKGKCAAARANAKETQMMNKILHYNKVVPIHRSWLATALVSTRICNTCSSKDNVRRVRYFTFAYSFVQQHL